MGTGGDIRERMSHMERECRLYKKGKRLQIRRYRISKCN